MTEETDPPQPEEPLAPDDEEFEPTGTTELGVEHGEHADFSFRFKVRTTDRVRHNWARPRTWGAIALLLVVVVLAGIIVRSWGHVPSGDLPPSKRDQKLASLPSFVLINTDDQRWDTLKYMPHVHDLLVKHGVTFNNSFVVNPVCCPSRAALLTGTYSHTNRVYDNKGPSGGFYSFNDAGSLGTFVDQDYTTGLFGKYLNNYSDAAHKGFVPPGWDEWHAFDREGYYDYDLNERPAGSTEIGTVHHFGRDPRDFSSTVLTDRIVSFIDQTQGPLMVYYAPPNPHLPSEYDAQDAHKFDHIPPWRPPSYNEADVSDKPDYVAKGPALTHADTRKIDGFRRDQLRSLQAVDRSVAQIVAALQATDRLSTTMIIFTSDNGMLWGEHRLTGKNVPYEESIRVPLVIRYDPLTSHAREDNNLIANIDITPTIVDLAGARAYKPEGMSIVPLLKNPQAKWRDAFLIEHYAEKTTQKVPTFCAVRSTRYKYVDYSWGKDELYDLSKDPHEMNNLIYNASLASVKADMMRRLDQLCRPKPPQSTDQQFTPSTP